MLLGSEAGISEGGVVRRTGRVVSVPVGEAMIGRVVNALGQPIDGKGPIGAADYRPIESPAPGILQRQPVREPLQTGIKAIDSMIPIGRGQRELIIGDRQTGKTGHRRGYHPEPEGRRRDLHLCGHRPDAVHRGRTGGGTFCRRRHGLHHRGVRHPRRNFRRCSISRPMRAAPWARYFMHKGRHVLVIYDDLSKHAVAYRALSLLIRRPPGREAYPGDVFYLHSRLLERAAKLSDALGGGSLTALPIIETQAGDVSGLYPHQRHLHHRRPDLPGDRAVPCGHHAGGQPRHLGLPRGRQRPDQGDEKGGRHLNYTYIY